MLEFLEYHLTTYIDLRSKPGGAAEEDPYRKWYALAGLAGMGILCYVAWNEIRYREITWNEFVNYYLARNAVSITFCV